MTFLRIVFIFVLGFFLHENFLTLVDYKFKELSEERDPKFVTMAQREKELECLTKNIYYEAGIESFEGKVAVAQVTLNRVQSKDFPNDICSVVYEKNIVYNRVICQFSWYCEQKTKVKPIHEETYKESEAVAKKVLLEGFRLSIISEDVLYYHANYVNPKWRKKRVTQIGKHIFYKG